MPASRLCACVLCLVPLQCVSMSSRYHSCCRLTHGDAAVIEAVHSCSECCCNAGHALRPLWTPCCKEEPSQESGFLRSQKPLQTECACCSSLHRAAFGLSSISHPGRLSQMPNRWAWDSTGEESCHIWPQAPTCTIKCPCRMLVLGHALQ